MRGSAQVPVSRVGPADGTCGTDADSASASGAALSSLQRTHASRSAPVLTAMSATLNVGHRASPIPRSRKSTTPREPGHSRSSRLPTAPPQTSPMATIRSRCPAFVPLYRRPRMTSATAVSTMKIHREYGPRYRPNAAPGLCTRVRRTQSPNTSRGTRAGTSARAAQYFVTPSRTTTAPTIDQKSRALLLLLSIFLALLASDAESRVRQRIESVEVDVLAAIMTPTECIR